jgi:FkbH-like protein
MEKIKLVIWDLDDTFWEGTLSEEGIKPIAAHISLIKQLTARGIINSIVSKNDYEITKKKLIELQIWDYFVFPSIAWEPKGLQIKHIISLCQLRDVNVLFLDDNHLNLEEARFYNAEIHVKEPDFIQEMLVHPAFKGKDDFEHSRLKQYKILEEKAVAKSNYQSSINFLINSKIKVQLISDLSDYKDRVLELLERTNQLNFTKIRSSSSEFDELLKDKSLENVLVKVVDKFGDYGLVGFYTYHRESHQLLHFVFSCRILNLGVPQFIFEKLNKPKLSIVPEVAESLDGDQPVWIEEIHSNLHHHVKDEFEENDDTLKILYKGGCEYDQLLFLLKNNNIKVIREVNYNTRENVPVYPYHTETILDSYTLAEELKLKRIQEPLNIFMDEDFFKSSLFENNYDCLVFNPRMDYNQYIYQHREEKFRICHGGFGNDFTDTKDHPDILEKFTKRRIPGITEKYFQKFAEQYENLGRISPEKFIENLKAIRKILPSHVPMVLINQPELNQPSILHGLEMKKRYKIMNSALDIFISASDNVYLLDVRNTIDHESKLESDISHFQRKYYRQLSLDLLQLLQHVISKKVNTSFSFKSIILDFGLMVFENTKAIKQKIFNKK